MDYRRRNKLRMMLRFPSGANGWESGAMPELGNKGRWSGGAEDKLSFQYIEF